MRFLRLTLVLVCLGFVFTANGYAVNPNCFDSMMVNTGKINGIYHTSCFDWVMADGYISGSLKNDKGRLQRAINAAFGKLIFDEADYFIGKGKDNTGHLDLFPWRILEGTGKGDFGDPTTPANSHQTSKIIQMSDGEPIFKIGPNVKDVAIRDLALVGGSPTLGKGTVGAIGILAEGGTSSNCSPGATPPDIGNCSSFEMQFKFLQFTNLNKGIYVNAVNNGEWQVDNVQIDHATFNTCNVGIHINSYNSGWTMKNLSFFMGAGNDISARNPSTTTMASWLSGKTIGIVLERSTYTSINSIIGNSLSFENNAGESSALIYIEGHAATIGIRNVVEEGFHKSVYIDANPSGQGDGGLLNFPIELENNTFQAPVYAKDVTLVSVANHFNTLASAANFAIADGATRVYSYGDKFCVEDGLNPCTDATYETLNNARLVHSTNNFKTITDVETSILRPNATLAQDLILRLGIGGGQYYYDITRNASTGTLDFNSSQGSAVNGGVNLPGYSGYHFNTVGGTGSRYNGATVKINYDGSVTYGTKTYAMLDYVTNYDSSSNYSYPHDDGTVVYCSDCQKTTPCSSGGSGALAKRINGSWDCD